MIDFELNNFSKGIIIVFFIGIGWLLDSKLVKDHYQRIDNLSNPNLILIVIAYQLVYVFLFLIFSLI
jgi:hypothetical protein